MGQFENLKIWKFEDEDSYCLEPIISNNYGSPIFKFSHHQIFKSICFIVKSLNFHIHLLRS